MTVRAWVLVPLAAALACGDHPDVVPAPIAPVTATVAPSASTAAPRSTVATVPSAPSTDSATAAEPGSEGGLSRLVERSAPEDTPPPSSFTDAQRNEAGDRYAARLGQFFRQRWQVPTSIPQAEAERLCVVFQLNVGRALVIWHVRSEPERKSGNDTFDDSARAMLVKLMDDHTALPDPPPEIADRFRGRAIKVALTASPKADLSRCR